MLSNSDHLLLDKKKLVHDSSVKSVSINERLASPKLLQKTQATQSGVHVAFWHLCWLSCNTMFLHLLCFMQQSSKAAMLSAQGLLKAVMSCSKPVPWIPAHPEASLGGCCSQSSFFTQPRYLHKAGWLPCCPVQVPSLAPSSIK